MVDGAAQGILVVGTCRVLGISAQALHTGRVNRISQRDWDDAHLTNAAIEVHDELTLAPGRVVGRNQGCPAVPGTHGRLGDGQAPRPIQIRHIGGP